MVRKLGKKGGKKKEHTMGEKKISQNKKIIPLL